MSNGLELLICGSIGVLFAISLWVMLGKISQLALIEAQEKNQIGFIHITFKDRDTTYMCYLNGPIMIVVCMMFYIINSLATRVEIIHKWISSRYYLVINRIYFKFKAYNETLKNRWDK